MGDSRKTSDDKKDSKLGEAELKGSSFPPPSRPVWAEAAVEERYQSALNQPIGYKTKGQPQYPFPSHGYVLFSEDFFIPARRSKYSEAITEVGDIGSGNNAFPDELNKKKGIHAIGITASDYGRKSLKDSKHDDTCILANAEELDKIKAFQNRDLIFSRCTFRHFADPGRSLCQAYAALKPGGALIIDNFSFTTCKNDNYFGFKGWHKDLIDYLKSEGYTIAAIQNSVLRGPDFQGQDITKDGYGVFVIVKTEDKPTLQLPIKYKPSRFVLDANNYDGDIGYDPTDALKDFREQKRREEKEEKIEAIDLDLKTLLKSKEFVTLNPLQQAEKIKAITNRMSSKQREDNFNSLEKDRSDAQQFEIIRNKETPHKLAVCEKWNIDPEKALIQIKALAALELEVTKQVEEFNSFLQKHFNINLYRDQSTIDLHKTNPILPIGLTDPVVKKMELFKFIYQTVRGAESGLIKSNFLSGREHLNTIELEEEVKKYSRQHPYSRTAAVWAVTQRLARQEFTLVQLETEIENLAARRSGISIFHRLDPKSRHDYVDNTCRNAARGFYKSQ